MGVWGRLVVSAMAAGQVRGAVRRPRGAAAPRGWGGWLGEPRSAVLIVLALVMLGGARRLLRGWRARGAVAQLGEPDVTAEAIEAAAAHGRAGLMDLFRLLGTAEAD